MCETVKYLLDESRLRLMKKSAYLINTARGAIVDEGALVNILSERAIAGAALDVFVKEPLPANHPLLQLENVVMTPHLGWPTDSGFAGFADFFGIPACTASGLARIALRTDAAVVPGFTIWDPALKKYRLRFDPALEWQLP